MTMKKMMVILMETELIAKTMTMRIASKTNLRASQAKRKKKRARKMNQNKRKTKMIKQISQSKKTSDST